MIYGSAAGCDWPFVERRGTRRARRARPDIYCLFLHHTWFAWETVRRKLYPAPNAWMVAIAATLWYATEIIGEVYNLGLGDISEIMFRRVWVFYGTNVVLWALSGYRWTKSPGAQVK